MNPYLADILAQPEALLRVIAQFPHPALAQVSQEMDRGAYDRVILTGMGASFNAAYPSAIELTRLPIPVALLNSAELHHYLAAGMGPRTLLWMNSQSGRSVELTNLLERTRAVPVARTLAFTNDGASPLAQGADLHVPILAGEETTVSTKTYTSMLAANLLAALQLGSGDLDRAAADLRLVAERMRAYLDTWEACAEDIDAQLGEARRLFVLGRGPSMAAAWNGALVCKEAARSAVEGMVAADFRHGPLEVVSQQVTVLFLQGPQATAAINRAFAAEIAGLGGRVVWVGASPHPDLPTLRVPTVPERYLPLVEILPLQLLSLVLARRQGLQAGEFRHIGKVTLKE